jgi:hypothetical protein
VAVEEPRLLVVKAPQPVDQSGEGAEQRAGKDSGFAGY